MIDLTSYIVMVSTFAFAYFIYRYKERKKKRGTIKLLFDNLVNIIKKGSVYSANLLRVYYGDLYLIGLVKTGDDGYSAINERYVMTGTRSGGGKATFAHSSYGFDKIKMSDDEFIESIKDYIKKEHNYKVKVKC